MICEAPPKMCLKKLLDGKYDCDEDEDTCGGTDVAGMNDFGDDDSKSTVTTASSGPKPKKMQTHNEKTVHWVKELSTQ